jgi:integrase
MATAKLTDLMVEKLGAPSTGRREIFDQALPAFGMRVTDSGVKSWFLMTRINGKLARLTLGRYPALKLAKARQKARDQLKEIGEGKDPRAAKPAPRRPDTVRNVVDEFLKRHAKVNNRSWPEAERIFNFDIIPAWGARDIRSISRRDVLELLDKIVDRGSPIMANRTLAHVRKLFNWSIARDLIDVSPCAKVAPPGKAIDRDRVLSDDEIAAVWQAAGRLGHPFATFVRVLLLTAQRREEVASMRRDQLDLDAALWTMPREATKSDRVHEVPLSPVVVDMLSAMPTLVIRDDAGRDIESPFVFTTTGRSPVSGFSKMKTALDAASGVTGWRLHDLRRTAATGMARLGTAPHVVEKVLAHSSGIISGVAAVYNRAGYDAEKRAALDAWARRVDAIVHGEPENVVRIEPRRTRRAR